MRVRHFGFLANHSKDRLSKCRQLLGLNYQLIFSDVRTEPLCNCYINKGPLRKKEKGGLNRRQKNQKGSRAVEGKRACQVLYGGLLQGEKRVLQTP
jgi:hypothetical protein